MPSHRRLPCRPCHRWRHQQRAQALPRRGFYTLQTVLDADEEDEDESEGDAEVEDSGAAGLRRLLQPKRPARKDVRSRTAGMLAQERAEWD